MNYFSFTIIAYLLIMTVGMLFTPTAFEEASGVMYDYITMAVLSVCIVQYIEDKKDIQTIIYAFMIAGLLLALYVYSMYGSSFWTFMRQSVSETHGSVNRLDGGLANANTISLCTAVSAIIAGYHVLYARTSKWKTVACVFVAAFCFIVSMAAGSKKSVILIFVCVVGIWYYSNIGNHNNTKKIRDLVAVIAAVLLLVWMINTLPIFSGVAQRFRSLFSFLSGESGTTSEQGRTNLMKAGLEVWLNHPLFGAGTASSIYYLGVYSHNNLLEMLINSGLFGFCVFYAVYVFAAKHYLKKAVIYRETDKYAPLLFALFCGVTVIGFAMVYYYDRYYMYLMATVFSAIRVYNAEIRTQQKIQSEKGESA